MGGEQKRLATIENKKWTYKSLGKRRVGGGNRKEDTKGGSEKIHAIRDVQPEREREAKKSKAKNAPDK